ncbi:thermonuclease family protein [Phormidium sp. CCY1219]|uniref:thermonuclease family protein n=1 Tax=Phormidium sp. CCY1219 TaxID=2886104 RepID=UPI002D1EA345|nr:thermonuclease family protein [Phormidium sp. CCY1219]MEB3830372.1 thermonuclease family protein [Phormidium sp. CCY1219]
MTRISDGDTITVRQGNDERRIRLCGIDAPEKNQPGGKEAKEFLARIISEGGDRVGMTFVEQDRYGRWVGEVWSAPETFEEQLLNSVMIGHAWPYTKYWGNCPNRSALAASEQSAEQSGRAIWKQPGAIAPWEYRKRNR